MKKNRFDLLAVWTAIVMLGAGGGYSQSLAPSDDGYVVVDEPGKQTASDWEISISGGDRQRQGFLRFDLSNIPAGQAVVSATLSFWLKEVTRDGAIDFHLVAQEWSEKSLAGSAADAAPTPIGRLAIHSEDRHSYLTVDVTETVRAWASGSVPNHGFALLPNGTVSVEIESREARTTHNRGSVISFLPGHPPLLNLQLSAGTLSASTNGAAAGNALPVGSSAAAAPARTVLVRAVPGQPASSAEALFRAVADADASATQPYIVSVEAGHYDLGNSSLVMKEFVDIVGAGEATVITSSANSGTVIGADHATLGSLTARNTASSDHAVAVRNVGVSPRLHQVTLVADNGSTEKAGTDLSFGVLNIDASPELVEVVVTARGGRTNHGVYNFNSAPVMRSVDIGVSGGYSNYGIYNDSSSPVMEKVTALAESGDVENHGMASFTSGRVICNGCAFTGATHSVVATEGPVVEIADSRLIGPVSEGSFHCDGVSSGDLTPFGPNCSLEQQADASAQADEVRR